MLVGWKQPDLARLTDVLQKEGGKSSSNEMAAFAGDFHFPLVSISDWEDGEFLFLFAAQKRDLEAEIGCAEGLLDGEIQLDDSSTYFSWRAHAECG